MTYVTFFRFKSYLKGRNQFIHVYDAIPNLDSIKCGAPLGSMLESLLLILFIKDISNTSHLVHTFFLPTILPFNRIRSCSNGIQNKEHRIGKYFAKLE